MNKPTMFISLLGWISQMDLAIYHFLGRFAGNWFLDRFASHEEGNNLLKGGVFFAIYWYLWFRDDADQKKRRRSIISILIAAICAVFAARAIAFALPFRIRPIYDLTL